MLRVVRRQPASSHGVRLFLLALSISIAGSLLAATRASAASSEWLAANVAQAAGDSVPPAPQDSIPPAAPPPSEQPPPSAPPTVTPIVVPPTTAKPVPPPQAHVPSPAELRRPPERKPPAYRLHLHGGLFAPIDVNATSPTIGLRLGRRWGSHLQGGLQGGWTLERKNLEQPVNGLPGLQPHLVLARAQAHLVPAMAFMQVNFTEKRYLVPYVGIAGGYEWFILEANDYRTDRKASATYANVAWESWGGLGFRLGPDLRFDSELFYNGGSLKRDVVDTNGRSWTEAVDVNGVGARVGVDIPF